MNKNKKKSVCFFFFFFLKIQKKKTHTRTHTHRITVGKAGLALNAAVEIDCIAYRGSTFATRFTKSIALLGGVVAGLYVAQKLLSDQM